MVRGAELALHVHRERRRRHAGVARRRRGTLVRCAVASLPAYPARRLEYLPVLVALAARVEEQESDARLFGQLRSEPDLEAVRPRPLSESAVALVIERDLGMAPDRAFVTACHGATAGNPFLTRELVSSLAIEGVVPHAESAGRLAESRRTASSGR